MPPEDDRARDRGEARSRSETVELAVDLLDHLADDELPLPELLDRLETVTTSPAVTREALEEAERRGVIEREDAVVRVHGSGTVRLDSRVIRREGDFSCRRCGAGITTGHFLRLDAGELGPFGSSCIRKVTGREE
ncbi:DUF5830 family protein [Halobaculum sp. CBA1158]|uniref:DUF5830 family protein n=1 Tax=Halobaculum sp. CBA1158 TaxID=2904243 RepID=UPI001F3933C4|nr:DUF5830 family protein [Halobaculum sp. CBA1158]UIO99465.1 DUF5830 family protein [Halobaculum sp. CBA1158]